MDSSDSGDRTPLYLRLADRLETDLAGMPAGTRVASEHQLMKSHGVSRLTARAALQELEQRFVVRRTRGLGTFVARRVDLLIAASMSPSMSDTERRAGLVPDRVMVSTRTRRCRSDIGELLDLDPDDQVVTVTRVGRVDSLPAWYGITHVPHELAEALPEQISAVGASMSLIDLLRAEFGLEPTLGWVRAQLETVPTAAADAMGLEGRPLVWNVELAAFDRSLGRPVALSQRWLRADVFRVHCEIDQR